MSFTRTRILGPPTRCSSVCPRARISMTIRMCTGCPSIRIRSLTGLTIVQVGDFMRLLTLILVLSTTALANRGITPEDYFAFQFMGDARISPDGKQVAYVLTAIDQKKNRRNSSIWLVSVDGQSAPRRLTAEGFNSNSPRWSPDGSRLAFLSARNTETPEPASSGSSEPARSQICILSMDGGEAQIASHLKNGV